MRGAEFGAVDFGGVKLCCMNNGENRPREPAIFKGAELDDCILKNCRLRNTQLVDCDLTGMTIDGVLVTECFGSTQFGSTRLRSGTEC